MTSERRRLAPVDGLRGLAIAIVLLAHVHEAVGYPYIANGTVFATVDFLRSGVDLFFVLSGFCLFYPLTRPGSRPNWAEFFRRRARRLLPPYYVAIAAVVLLPLALGPVASRLGLVTTPYGMPSWRSLCTHLLVIQTLFTDTFYDFDSPLWSLGLEIQFYLAFPLAVWLVYRLGWRGIGLIVAVTLAYRILATSSALGLSRWPVDVADLFPGRWLEFALGMLVAGQVRRVGDGRLSRSSELFDLAGILVLYLLGAYYLYGPAADWPYPHKDLLFSAGYAMLLYLACAPGSLLGSLLSHPLPVWLGTISYSLYLIHFPILFALAPSVTALHLPNYANVLVLLLVGAPLSVGCAAIFYILFERPFLNTRPAAQADVRAERDRDQAAAIARQQGGLLSDRL